jgi:dipeptide/tripeptide permease
VVNSAVALALAAAGTITFMAMSREGLPPEAGAPPDVALLKKPIVGPLSPEWLTYIGSFVIVPAVALLLWSNAQYQFISDETLAPMIDAGGLSRLAGTLLGEFSRPTGLLLGLSGLAFVYIFAEAVRSHRIIRNRLLVVLVLFGFSALFWSFFEQAGSSMTNFADRNVDRVFEGQTVTAEELGQMPLTLTQEQLGYNQNGKVFTLDQLDDARSQDALNVTWTLTEEHIGMGIVSDSAGGSVVPASTFQSANPIYILLFGMLFSAMWGGLGRKGIEPSAPMKFVLGLLQLGLGFIVLWYGASIADGRGMTGMSWLLLGYLLHTTGELCLSPIGLSMVVKLSPKHLVATVMGGWFLATAFSGYVAAIIATFTSVGGHGGGDGSVPPPIETIGVYGSVFLSIGLAALASAVLLLILVPFLKMGMHEGVVVDETENG